MEEGAYWYTAGVTQSLGLYFPIHGSYWKDHSYEAHDSNFPTHQTLSTIAVLLELQSITVYCVFLVGMLKRELSTPMIDSPP